MGHHRLFYQNSKLVRDSLNECSDLADLILSNEQILIQKLALVDQRRFYIRYGFKSLSGFCRDGLKFSKTQTQRLVTQVRRYEPTDNIVVKTYQDCQTNL